MAKEHILLTLEEFEELQQGNFTPLEQLPIPQEEKDRLIEKAQEKYGSEFHELVCYAGGGVVICFGGPRGPRPT